VHSKKLKEKVVETIYGLVLATGYSIFAYGSLIMEEMFQTDYDSIFAWRNYHEYILGCINMFDKYV